MKHDIFFDPDSHIYLVDGQEVPSVTAILQPLSNRSYAAVSLSVLDYARRRGTAVHEALETIDLGAEPEDIMPEIIPYIRAYEEWKSIYSPTFTDIEQIVYEDELEYIGTLDRAGQLNDNEFAIIDIKTSNPTKEALVSVCLQTAAYAIAYPNNVEISRYALFLKPDGSFRFQNCTEYESRYGFSGYGSWLKMLEYYKMISKLLETRGKNGTD